MKLSHSHSKQEILNTLNTYREKDLNPHGGNVWAYVYDSGLSEVEDVASAAYKMYMNHNGLDFTVFPSLLKMENDIVGYVASLFSNSPDSVGTFTSGGTESIILAVKAARDYYHEQKPEITQPEILLPETAHAAFHKAAHLLGLKPVNVAVNPETFKVDPEEIVKYITANTIMIVGSSVNYSHGVSDPIEELAAIATQYQLWLHVDACIGGFLLAYYKKLGVSVKPFGLDIPGVSSLSVDLHKYAYAPKGASVVLYKNQYLRSYQYYACTNWTGYPVINTTIQSTKSGGPLASCWATMQFIGEDGYLKLTQQILNAKERLIEGLKTFSDIRVLGCPEASLLALGSDTVDLFQLADVMREMGWYIQVQPGRAPMAPTLHLTLTPVSEARVDGFLVDLEKAIQTTKTTPRTPIVEKWKVIPENLSMEQMLTAVGVRADGVLPNAMADINELLRLLPSEMTEEAFIHITNKLFSPETSHLREEK